MAQPANLDIVYVDKFSSDIRHLAQQTDSRLQFCTQPSYDVGEYHYFDTIDSSRLVMTPKGIKQETKTKWADAEMMRRRCFAPTLDIALTYEPEALQKIIMNPSVEFQMDLVALANRTKDKIIFNALLDPAPVEMSLNSNTTIPFPASQTLTTAKLDIKTLIAAKNKFLGNEISDEKITCILDAKSYTELLEDDKSVNRDFVSDTPTTTGELGMRLGFSFQLYNNNADTTTATTRNVILSTGRTVGLAVPPNFFNIRIDELVEHSYLWQFYMVLSYGGVRLAEENVVMIKVTG